VRSIEEAAREAASCVRCRLARGRTQVVYGVGNPRAELMFIGEAPGYHEDRQGEPFVGAAGQLLTKMLEGIGLRREDVYIANVLKCLGYDAMVQLADGSWERIGRLVRSRYQGSVMSVDADGRLVARRVIGWHETPIAGRRIFRLSYASAKDAGAGWVSVELTGDHPVLTERGWVAAEELRPDDRIATGQGLSDTAFDVVCGTVLGDGRLSGNGSYLSFCHGEAQRDYAFFKAALLEELSPRTTVLRAAAGNGGAARGVVQVRTLPHRALRLLRSDFYRPRKRVPPWVAERLNDRMLAIWFMDEGDTRIRPPRRASSEIATVGFPEEDLPTLVAGLRRLGLTPSVQRGRIHFDLRESEALSIAIAPYVPPPMRHKLHPEVARRIPYDPDRFATGPPRAMYDRVDVRDVTHRPRTDATFFCIDVEGTHNFVTAGGVVHNCRPPGNRDPLPDEIEACRPWLAEQIDLIDPRIIVTLGNFATRFILDRPVSISRVRGQRFAWRGKVVIPTFHPAAVLHGGGQASSQMEGLRRDFEEVRAALAERPPPVEEQLGLF